MADLPVGDFSLLFQNTLNGNLSRTNYDKKYSDDNKGISTFSANGLATLIIKNISGIERRISSIGLKIDDTYFFKAKVKLKKNNSFISSNYLLKNNESIGMSISDGIYIINDNFYLEHSFYTKVFENPGTFYITTVVEFSDGSIATYRNEQFVNVYNPVLERIEYHKFIDNVEQSDIKYYVGQSLNPNGVVYAYYKFFVQNTFAYSDENVTSFKVYSGATQITSYTFTDNDLNVSSSEGTKEFTISYGNKTTLISVNIYGKKSIYVAEPTRNRFEVGETITNVFPENAIITYGDNTTESVTINYDYDFSSGGYTNVTALFNDYYSNVQYSKITRVEVVYSMPEEFLSITAVSSSIEFQNYLSNFTLDGLEFIFVDTFGESHTGVITNNTIEVENYTNIVIDGCSYGVGTPITVTNLNNTTITFKYDGKSYTTQPFAIPVKYVTRLEMVRQPKNLFYVNETFSKGDLQLNAIYSDGSVVENVSVTTNNDGHLFVESDISESRLVRATYTYFTNASAYIDYFVVVHSDVLLSAEITTTPNLTFNFGDTFDISSMVVKPTSYASGREISPSETINSYTITIDNNPIVTTKTVDLQDNNKIVRIELDGLQTPLVVGTMVVNSTYSIELAETPKTTYKVGETYKLDYNDSKIKLLVTYNGYTSSKYLSDPDVDIKINGTSIKNNYVFESSGTPTAIISYEFQDGHTETINLSLNVSMPNIVGIIVNTNQNGEDFSVGESWTPETSISSVKYLYDNGYIGSESLQYSCDTTQLAWLNSEEKITDADGLGSKEITVTYETYSTTFSINITNNLSVDRLSVVFKDYTYKVGDYFRLQDIESFEVLFAGQTKTVKIIPTQFNTITNPAYNFQFLSGGRKSINITYNNYLFTYTIDVVYPSDYQTKQNTYKLAFNVSEVRNIKFGKIYNADLELVSELYPVFLDKQISLDTANNKNYYTGNNAEQDCIGYVDVGTNSNAHLVLFEDVMNPLEADNNISITFPHYVDGYSNQINKCRFGKIYNERLFVSGNPEKPNCDWHTSSIDTNTVLNKDTENYDAITYFSDLDYCFYGSADTAIVGYDIYQDGDLIVVKQGSKREATIYRREKTFITATDYKGNKIDGQIEEAYPSFDINANGGEGGLSNRTIINFNGDTLILTRSGLKALVNKENVYGESKYLVDMSTNINAKITKGNIENDYLYSFKEKIILRANNGVYIGEYNLRSDNNEYEWYYLSNINADLFFELDNELYFTDNNGSIYRFSINNDTYIDKNRHYLSEATINFSNNVVTLGGLNHITVNDGDEFHLIKHFNGFELDKTSLGFGNLGEFIDKNSRNNIDVLNKQKYNGSFDKENGYWFIEIDPINADGTLNIDKIIEIQDLFYDGREIYFDLFNQNNINIYTYTKYKLKKINEDNTNKYIITNLDGSYTDFGEGYIPSFRLSFMVNELAISKIQLLEGSTNSFYLIGDHNKQIDFIEYNQETAHAFSGVITDNQIVIAYYETKPFNFGSIIYEKTLWEWAVTNDTELNSNIDVKIITSRASGDYDLNAKTSTDAGQFSFSDLDFSKVQFTSDRLPHVYSRIKVYSNVVYARFKFINVEDSNAVLSALQIIYTISGQTKGVR